MSIFISPLIKAHAYFAIIEGHVFYALFVRFSKQKERNEKYKFLSVPLIKGDDPFAIIEGHVFT